MAVLVNLLGNRRTSIFKSELDNARRAKQAGQLHLDIFGQDPVAFLRPEHGF